MKRNLNKTVKMERTLAINLDMTAARNEAIGATVNKERKRLFDFIKRRIPNEADAEDILQDVLYQYVANYDLPEPIEKAANWLFRVALNKITDWYRKKKPVLLEKRATADGDSDDDGPSYFEEVLFDTGNEPDELYLRDSFWDLLSEALEELPKEQREVFVLHELEDKSFKEIAEMTGVAQNTLLSRKRYAVLYLRERLQEMYKDFLNN